MAKKISEELLFESQTCTVHKQQVLMYKLDNNLIHQTANILSQLFCKQQILSKEQRRLSTTKNIYLIVFSILEIFIK